MNTPPSVPEPSSAPSALSALRACALAVVTTTVGVALTRLTWPFFSPTPFAPVFLAVAVSTHWGSLRAGLLAIALAVIGAALTLPTTGPVPWQPLTLVAFVAVALVGTLLIAGRDRASAALKKSEAQMRATWEHATLGAALLDASGRIERINPALERMFGCTAEAATGMAFSAFTHPDEEETERLRFAAFVVSPDDFYQNEQRYRRQDGAASWARVTVSAIRGASGQPVGALAVLEDVTARRQAEADLHASEERLRRAQKMEAVGRLVAGVAHNFNNLLTITMGYTDTLLDHHVAEDLERTAVQEIRKATERGAALTRQLLAFGRKHDPRVARIDLASTVTGLREMLSRVIREDIELTIDVEGAPLAVLIDPHDLEQVLFNLVINARDALPAGGAIHVDVVRVPVQASDIPLDTSAGPGQYLRLRVQDNGIGMPPDVQAHLFEPFFTTKEVGEGTGLGLAFVHGIARHGGGFVAVETAPGKGTTVSVYLPPAPAAVVADAPAPADGTASARRSAATILLVEDDNGVRDMTARILSRAGYRVLSAATPGEALGVFDRYGEDIDLLLTDVVMPDMHGPVLAERLVAKNPKLRVLFVSGYSDAMPANAGRPANGHFLAKPFASSRLMTVVGEVLAVHHG